MGGRTILVWEVRDLRLRNARCVIDGEAEWSLLLFSAMFIFPAPTLPVLRAEDT